MRLDPDPSFVKVCPRCGAEFVPTTETCYDCGATLETRPLSAEAPAQAKPAPSTEPASTDGWVAIQSADLDWARELAERLAAAGIEARLGQDCSSCSPKLDVFVAPENAAAAHAVARQSYVERVPDLDPAALASSSADRCPACGAGLGASAAECPDCGLAFPEPGAPGD